MRREITTALGQARSKSHSQAGAVLLMVLVVIVALSLAIGLATRIINQRLVTAHDSKQNIDTLMHSEALLAELTYILATQRATVAGIRRGISSAQGIEDSEIGSERFSILPKGDEIRTDAFVYSTENLRYRIQSESGLIAINSPEQMWLRRYLEQQGLSRLAVNSLLDSLADYADKDDKRRAAGAESFSYNGLSGGAKEARLPSNYLLQSCDEVRVIKHWEARDDLIARLNELCSTSRSARLNINSMPLSLLQTLFPNYAEQIWQNRQSGQWIVSENDVIKTIPFMLNMDTQFYTLVSGPDYLIHIAPLDPDTPFSARHLRLGRGNLPPFILE